MVGGSGCGDGCLVWATRRISSSLPAGGHQGSSRNAQLPVEAKGTALGLVRCRPPGRLVPPGGILDCGGAGGGGGNSVHLRRRYFDRCPARSPAEQWAEGTGGSLVSRVSTWFRNSRKRPALCLRCVPVPVPLAGD